CRSSARPIADAAEAAYPGECCGLLIGIQHKNGVQEVKRVAPSRNLGKARDRFEIDPQLWVDLTRAHRGGSTRIVGLYHSHPDGPAQPSAVDLEAAWGEELVWLIVSVAGDGKKGQAVHVTAHLLDHGGRQFREIPLRTSDWHPNFVRTLPEDTKEAAS
ncbi:MAG TPA: M67 family metallopeptidase, partial [Alphaproteobacteria bacterium]|nr:M67 family metallopeptidase [Alphaproteobacteria bacterium]